VGDIFWSHPDVVKLINVYNLVFLIDITYKTNRYMLSLLDIVGVTPTGMTFPAAFAYKTNKYRLSLLDVICALQRF